MLIIPCTNETTASSPCSYVSKISSIPSPSLLKEGMLTEEGECKPKGGKNKSTYRKVLENRRFFRLK